MGVVKTWNGIARASLKTWDGIAAASVKTINGLDATTGGGSFDPTDYGTVLIWLKADAITGLSDTDPVASWDDSGPAATGVAQGTSGSRPVYRTGIVNSLPVVSFDGNTVAKYLDRASSMSTCRTIFVVSRWTGTTGDYRVLLGDSSAADFHGSDSGTPRYLISGAYAAASVTGGSAWNSGASITPANLVRDTNWSVVTFQPTANVTLGRFGLDRNYDWTSPPRCFYGDVAEILIYSDALSTGNREAVEDALGTKYGITITH